MKLQSKKTAAIVGAVVCGALIALMIINVPESSWETYPVVTALIFVSSVFFLFYFPFSSSSIKNIGTFGLSIILMFAFASLSCYTFLLSFAGLNNFFKSIFVLQIASGILSFITVFYSRSRIGALEAAQDTNLRAVKAELVAQLEGLSRGAKESSMIREIRALTDKINFGTVSKDGLLDGERAKAMAEIRMLISTVPNVTPEEGLIILKAVDEKLHAAGVI